MMSPVFVAAKPYRWPYNGDLQPSNTALIVIDMQVDFCGEGGYVDCMGYDLGLTRAPIGPIKRVLAVCRSLGFCIVHTREGHRPDLSDLPENKRWRSEQIGAGIGSVGPCGRILVRGEPGWEIIPELAPQEGEVVIDKPGKGSFYATDLDLILRNAAIKNLIVCGITTDVCVHTTMRVANDMGYECLLLTDCTGATDEGNHEAAIKMVTMQGGVFGAVATSQDLIAALESKMAAPLPVAPADTPVVEVAATPYAYHFPLSHTALLLIDFQRDFLCEGGFASTLGNDVKRLRGCLPAARQLLDHCRAAGMLVIHTLECHLPDLSDLHPSKANRGQLPKGQRIGDAGGLGGRILIKGEPGNGIVEEVAPLEGEKLIHKPGKGAFYSTDLQDYLQSHSITHLLLGGVTTEVCVQTTMREANDRGYECLLLTDATESYFEEFKEMTVKMVHAQMGIVGWTSTTSDVIAALSRIKT